MALSCNTKLIYPQQNILEDTYEPMLPKAGHSARNGELAWPALLRKLDRTDPSYQTENLSWGTASARCLGDACL
jgi:hypothetical protein